MNRSKVRVFQKPYDGWRDRHLHAEGNPRELTSRLEARSCLALNVLPLGQLDSGALTGRR